MASSPTDVEALTREAAHLLAAKMYSLAACVMLFYDICITFSDEVEKVWRQRFSFVTVLWFMNRYLSPLGYIVIIVSFQDPNWSKSVCDRYVLYPEVLKLFTALAIGAIFILRLYSIYGRDNRLLVFLILLLMAELGVKIWAFTDGTAVDLPPGLVGCILTGRGDSDDRFVYTWVAELVFDTVIFLLTLYRTLSIYRKHRHGGGTYLVKLILRDGIVYFLVIFAANLVTVTLFIALPPDLKAINASFSTLITSLMVSRLILNLRSQANRHAIKPSLSLPSQLPVLVSAGQSQLSSSHKFGDTVYSDWLESEEDPESTGIYAQTTLGDNNLDVTELNVIHPTQSSSNHILAAPHTAHVTVEVIRSVCVEDTNNRESGAPSFLPTPTLPNHDPNYQHTSASTSRFLGIPKDFSHSRAQEPLFPPAPQPTLTTYPKVFETLNDYHATRSSSSHRETRTRARDDDRDHWFPPDSWRVEGVDAEDLGKLRQPLASASRKRPRTS